MNLNVAIVDDHPLVLKGLKSLLLQTEETEGIEHIYTAQTGSQLGSLPV
jgi:YesN/AraC family two-component response regulator